MLALLVCLPLADASLDGFHLPKELVLAVAALLGVAWCPAPVDALGRLLWLIAGLSFLSAVFAIDGWSAARAATLTLATVVGFESARRLGALEASRLERVALLSLTAVALLAAVEALGMLHLSGPGRAPGSTLGQRNAVAHVLVLGAPFAWERTSARWRDGLIAAVFAFVVLLTRSRAAWAGALVAALVFAITARRRAGPGLLASGAGLLVAGLLPTMLPWRTGHPQLDTASRWFDWGHGSGLGRLREWRFTLELIREHPLLGVGPGNWMAAYPATGAPLDADLRFPTGRLLTNDWLAFAAERGLLAALALLAVGVLIVASSRSPAVTAALVSLAVMASLDSLLQLAAPLAVCCALIAPRLTVPEGRAPVAARAIAGALLAAGALLLAFSTAGFVVRANGDLASLERAVQLAPGDVRARYTLVEADEARGDCDAARPHLEALSRLLPNHPSVKAMRARCP